MICPSCGHTLELCCRITPDQAAKALGALGGRTKGKSKARDVDYAALARLSHQRRRENKAKR